MLCGVPEIIFGREVESWLTDTWGRKLINIKLLETDTVLPQVSYDEKV